ncbi:hypothetical protein LTR37_010357 [Vermiconidia calcicola]|uniref:Uncharacterized protein n=1 Tax=Vermiconidia calcicola TaxID=1690605 RepID=A0ACC3N6C1_9PEZI|nr:hypothetical protein LTR37_010357 [Vermiconidia calcicola]
MRLTEHTALSSSKTLLVPYCQHHVPTYHKWMQDSDLQNSTASEPLSLDEEYAMQQSWRTDKDKLTFIICLPLSRAWDELDNPFSGDQKLVRAREHDAEGQMIGDINLFLFEQEDEEPNLETPNDATIAPCLVGEIELMIARKDLHRRGFGRSALLTFLSYVLSSWPRIAHEYTRKQDDAEASLPELAYLRAKINQTNERSIRLFESLGFERTSAAPNFFGEVELRCKPAIEGLKKLKPFELHQILQYVDGS